MPGCLTNFLPVSGGKRSNGGDPTLNVSSSHRVVVEHFTSLPFFITNCNIRMTSF